MNNTTKKCPECGKAHNEQSVFCSYFCDFQNNERNTRYVGAYGYNDHGDYEDREDRF